jgi:hypothetical protein
VTTTASYLSGLADRCHLLALRCFDLNTAGQLNAIGDELAAKSRELDRAGRIDDSCRRHEEDQ